MPFAEGDPVTQDQRLDALYRMQQQEKTAKETFSKDVADRASQIYRDAPYIPASVILSMAKSGTSPETVQAIKKTAALKTARDLDPNKPKKKGWFQEIIADNVKAASRWTFAGLSLVPDLVQNVASQAFSPNDPAGFDGWFKSTQLGTLMSNTQEAGEGFFLGEVAMEKQGERARRVRGEINGHAWTIGRGAAELAFTPGSKPYGILSGFVDAAVNIGTDPTLIAGKALAPVKAARAALPGLATLDEIENASKLAKGVAGLNSAEGIAFQASKFGKWVTSDSRAQRLVTRIVEVSSDAAKSVEEKTLFMLENIPGLDPATARAFAEADDTAKVYGLLGTVSARLATNPSDVLLPTDIRDIDLARFSKGWDDGIKERVGFYRTFRNKWLQTMPKGSVVINGTGADKTEAVKSYARYMRGAGLIDETPEFKTVMQKVVEAYSSTDPATARASVKEAYDLMLETVFTHLGGKSPQAKLAAQELIGAARSARARLFQVDELGNADDGGALQQLRSVLPQNALDEFDITVHDRLTIAGPGALNELADDVEILPDFRRVRALAGNPWLTRNAAGKERAAAVMASFVQQEIWKPLALATGGYMMRNMIDAQTRIAMSGRRGLFNHPMDFIMWVTRRKGGFDITGEDFGKVTGVWNKEQDTFWQALTFDLHKNLKDPYLAEQKLLRNGNFSIADRGADATAHVTGYVDNLALINDDVILNQVARLNLEGLTQPERVQRITDWLNDPQQSELLGQLRNYFAEGVKITDPQTGKTARISIDPNDLDESVNAWVDKLAEFKVGTIVRGNDELSVVSGYNKVPLTYDLGDGRVGAVGTVNIDPANIDPKDILEGPGGIGSVIRLSTGEEGLIIRSIDTPNGIDPFTGLPITKTEYVVQPVFAGPAFTADGLGTQNLRNLVDTLGLDGKLAQKVKIAQRGMGDGSTAGQKFLQAKDKFVDMFFVNLYGTVTKTLEKSPVFRQSYYDEVFRNADLLDPAEAKILLDRVKQNAAAAGMKPENYVGGKKVLARIEEQANSTSQAIGTVDQLDDFAKASALRKTQELLYNATERSNLEDVMRIIIPFGGAWKEVLGTYAKAVIEDPTRIRKAQLIFDGARKFDPDNNGEGFFYKDATTGEYSFNFPLSGQLTKLVTGLEAPMQAPVKRISIGLGLVPSIGPMAQIAASKIIPDTPAMDSISKLLLPYGKKEGFTITPLWIQRLNQAWEGDTQNLQTVYGNTYIETLRALSASGEYDLSDPNEQEKLYADARGKARSLTALRALGQFFGPTSPAPEFKIDTISGDFYGTQLVKEFQKLQANNYDTAVSEFLRIYGNDALLYISNKTESVAGGLEATDDFGDWERSEGKGLINQYPDVAGFMAPGGDNFSFEVWSRQVAKGRRRRLTDREIVELAQYRAASAQYRALRDKLPPRPTSEQKRWLRQWREKLNKEYPGFPVVAEFNPGEFPKKLEQLTRLVQDDRLADNDVADATRQYLQAREAAVERYVQAGGAPGGFSTAVAAGPLRDWLAGVGKALKEDTPEFARLYERLLSTEVEE
jgi:hypothetical protein